MKILSFDIEEWSLAKFRGITSPSIYAEYDRILDILLDNLDASGLKATFFCTGSMAQLFPMIVKKIYNRGHEIGCHSNSHTWLNKMSYSECQEDTHSAIDLIEQCIGQKVLSYRAPAFSICESNIFALEILANNGIERDSSIFPAKRDFGGFSSFGKNEPTVIEVNGVKITEFPIPTTSLLNIKMAYSGGGYFRFFPYLFIQNKILTSDYVMTYFHVGDFTKLSSRFPSKEEYENYYKQPGTLFSRYTRYIKNNIGKGDALDKFSRLIGSGIPFLNIDQACNEIDLDIIPHVLF